MFARMIRRSGRGVNRGYDEEVRVGILCKYTAGVPSDFFLHMGDVRSGHA